MENEKEPKGVTEGILNRIFYSMGSVWSKVVNAEDVAKSDGWKIKAKMPDAAVEKADAVGPAGIDEADRDGSIDTGEKIDKDAGGNRFDPVMEKEITRLDRATADVK